MRYLSLLLIVFACRSVTPTTTTNTFDSTKVVVRERIDTLYLPSETIENEVYIECDDATNKPIPFKTKKAGKNLTLITSLDKKGLLKTSCKEDSLIQVTKHLDSIVFRLRHEDKTITLPPIVTHTPYWFDVLFRWWALLTAVYLAWVNRKGLIGWLAKLTR